MRFVAGYLYLHEGPQRSERALYPDTNWRSAPTVNSVNKLFSQMNDAFMFRDISLQSGKVCAQKPVAAI